jgi:predicted small lipoprotein YifL
VKAIIIVVFAIWSLAACGTVGSPIPPEDVGVGPTIEQQKRLDAEAAKREAEPQPVLEPLGQDVDLPPLFPVGTR